MRASTKPNHALRGAVALFVLASIYGFIGYFGRELAPGLSIWQQMYLRLILSLPFLWITFYKRIDLKNCLALFKTEPGLVFLRAVCLFVIAVPLYIYAVQHAKLGNVALMQILPYTFILGALINKERLNLVKVLLMLVAFGGALLIAVQDGLDFSNLGSGELASVVSGVFISLGFVTRKKHKANSNDYEISFTIMALGLVMLAAMSLLTGDGLPRPAVTDTRFFVILIIAACVNSIIFLLVNYGFRYVRDTLANNILTLEGLFGLIFGFVIYSETPVSREILGASIILLSAMASTYVAKREEK